MLLGHSQKLNDVVSKENTVSRSLQNCDISKNETTQIKKKMERTKQKLSNHIIMWLEVQGLNLLS